MKIAIPARYASTRFPGKPLFELAGKPMIQHVWQQAIKAFECPEDVYIATDDERIAEVVGGFGGQVCFTAASHENGTERLAELVDLLSLSDDEIVINVQGDEPLIDPSLIRLVGEQLANTADAHLATAADTITDPVALDDYNIVKVVCAKDGSAHYFSRACIPHNRDGIPEGSPYLRHIGIYAYRAGTLRALTKLEPAPTEQLEKLEQLRALWHGMKITVAHYHGPSAIGVDTPADAARVDKILRDAAQTT
ncbi:3-deoxy-manno-octulosonate cytidylyltransferase [Kordiimonas aquimaris]|uniref:3-deoxy-manno-octulosonate cytidylyltransferase n=1 Tax=Kordiimonas aquimaris TaxID=707591 RepID=UPI0021D14A5F|nr:3-deoxy-manno-octulosonate cytidylyltransferase [Kordiimonas aquimaris]